MFSPYRAFLPSFRQLLDNSRLANVYAKGFNGGAAPAMPVDPLRFLMPTGKLAGSRQMVTDQRISGLNAVLWNDPSMIL